MAEAKTQVTMIAPEDYLTTVEPAARRVEGEQLDALFRRATGEEPRMWGPTIIGYGSYHYRYESGREGRAARVGFSPRKAKLTMYLLGCGDDTAEDAFAPMLARLGKHSRGVSCLYVNKLADIDLAVLEEIVRLSWSRSFNDWPES